MKRIVLLLLLVAFVFSGCAGAQAKITETKAKEIALNDAGVSENDVTFIKTEKEKDDGITVYEIEFYTKDKTEHDYKINADTGNIVAHDTDAENKVPSSANPSESTTSQTEKITEEKAKEIALAKVPGATVENIREFEKDIDDGREEYEGKIIYNDIEYEFEIDAKTGNIKNWESESVYD